MRRLVLLMPQSSQTGLWRHGRRSHLRLGYAGGRERSPMILDGHFANERFTGENYEEEPMRHKPSDFYAEIASIVDRVVKKPYRDEPLTDHEIDVIQDQVMMLCAKERKD